MKSMGWILIVGAVAVALYLLVYKHPAATLTRTPPTSAGMSTSGYSPVAPASSLNIGNLAASTFTSIFKLFTDGGNTPSPIIENGSLGTRVTGASAYAAGYSSYSAAKPFVGPVALPSDLGTDASGNLIAWSPSSIVPDFGSPAVDGSNDINPGLDYPGIQPYMVDPMTADPNVYYS